MACSNRRPSYAPIPRPNRPISSDGSSCVGRSRSPSRKPAPISASRPSGNGPTSPFCEPRQPSSVSSRSFVSGLTTSTQPPPSSLAPPHGIESLCQPSAMLSRRSAAKSGRIRILACPGRAETVYKSPGRSGTASPTRSHMPPDWTKSSSGETHESSDNQAVDEA
jgi:hypothetical protein